MSKFESVKVELASYSEAEMKQRSLAFFELMKTRHSTRDFADKPVPLEVIHNALKTAGRAPSGANQQPWHFAVVTNKDLKHKIRLAAEEEERAFYEGGRASEEWLDALAPLGTDADKSFIDRAAALIIIFAQAYGLEGGNKTKHYYVQESVGIATGFLIAALHNAGLACLTHTPSPMGFLADILGRPKNERAYINLVVGYPAEETTVPAHAKQKKELNEFVSFFD